MIHTTPQSGESALEGLALSERFLLWNVRAWACCCRGRRLPAEPVETAFANIGIPAAAIALDAAMTRLVLATRRPLAVHCPQHTGLSDDETMLIGAARAAQRDDPEDARDLLAAALPGPAADLVGHALADLGRLLATVGILLPQPGRPERLPSGVVAIGAPAPTLH